MCIVRVIDDGVTKIVSLWMSYRRNIYIIFSQEFWIDCFKITRKSLRTVDGSVDTWRILVSKKLNSIPNIERNAKSRRSIYDLLTFRIWVKHYDNVYFIVIHSCSMRGDFQGILKRSLQILVILQDNFATVMWKI